MGGALKAWTAPGWRLARRVRELFPLTPLGLLVAGSSAGAYWLFAIPHLDYVLQIVSAIALGLVGATTFCTMLAVWLTVRALARGAASSPESIAFEAHRGFGWGLCLRRFRWIPAVDVSWHWLRPTGVVANIEIDDDRRRSRARIESEVRAYADRIERRYVVEDSFGLTRISFRRVDAQRVEIAPWSGALRGATFLRALVAGEDVAHPAGALAGDRVDMRRYAVGDPLRLVLWKVYARSGQLVVRTPERTVAPKVRVLGYLVAAPGDEPAAAAALVSLESGRMGDTWVFGADGESGGSTNVPDARRRVIKSATVKHSVGGSGAGLRAFVDGERGPEPSRLVVFAPAMEGRWIDAVADVARRVPTLVLLAADGLCAEPSKPATRWATAKAGVMRWLKTPGVTRAMRVTAASGPIDDAAAAVDAAAAIDGTAAIDALALGALARRLVASGADVEGVDRLSGRPLDLGHAAARGYVADKRVAASGDAARSRAARRDAIERDVA